MLNPFFQELPFPLFLSSILFKCIFMTSHILLSVSPGMINITKNKYTMIYRQNNYLSPPLQQLKEYMYSGKQFVRLILNGTGFWFHQGKFQFNILFNFYFSWISIFLSGENFQSTPPPSLYKVLFYVMQGALRVCLWSIWDIR